MSFTYIRIAPRFVLISLFLLLLLAGVDGSAQKKTAGENRLKDGIVYRVILDRFANGDTTNDPPTVTYWEARPKEGVPFGGDLRGALERVGYFKRLGITTLIIDDVYRDGEVAGMNTSLGSESELDAFIDECNTAGIRVIARLPSQGKGEKATQHLEILQKFGIVGAYFPLPPDELAPAWLDAKKKTKGNSSSFSYVVNAPDGASQPVQQGDAAGMFNTHFRDACIAFLAEQAMRPSQFDSVLQALQKLYPGEMQFTMLNAISDETTGRFLTNAKGNSYRLSTAFLMQMAYPGIPVLYYGDEIGLSGRPGLESVRTMEIDSTQWNYQILKNYTKLSTLREAYPLFRKGKFETAIVDDRKGIYGFWRIDGNDRALILVNNSPTAKMVPVSLPEGLPDKWIDLMNGRRYKNVENSLGILSLAGPWGTILVPDTTP